MILRLAFGVGVLHEAFFISSAHQKSIRAFVATSIQSIFINFPRQSAVSTDSSFGRIESVQESKIHPPITNH